MSAELRRVTPRVVLGAAVMLIGILFTLENLKILNADRLWRYWPVVFILIGLSHLRSDRRGQAGAYFWIAFGVWFLAHNIGIVQLGPWDLWPLALVLFGASILRRALSPKRASPPEVGGESQVSAFALMSGIERSSNAPDFKGGELTAIMGGCEIDLRHAAIVGGEAVIDIFVLMGGVGLRVPEDWTVVSQVVPIMGGYEDKTSPPRGDASRRLVLKGVVLMGGVEVKN